MDSRNIEEYKKREEGECFPKNLVVRKEYSFLKIDQRNYWLHGDILLLETGRNEKLSRSKASVIVLEIAHFLDKGTLYTKGKYKVIEVFMMMKYILKDMSE